MAWRQKWSNAFIHGEAQAERRCIFFWLMGTHSIFLNLDVYSRGSYVNDLGELSFAIKKSGSYGHVQGGLSDGGQVKLSGLSPHVHNKVNNTHPADL